MANGNSVIDVQDEEERSDFWGMRDRLGYGRETEASEHLHWYENRSIEKRNESKGEANEHSDINHRGKRFGEINQHAAHESSGNVIDSSNSEAPPF